MKCKFYILHFHQWNVSFISYIRMCVLSHSKLYGKNYNLPHYFVQEQQMLVQYWWQMYPKVKNSKHTMQPAFIKSPSSPTAPSTRKPKYTFLSYCCFCPVFCDRIWKSLCSQQYIIPIPVLKVTKWRRKKPGSLSSKWSKTTCAAQNFQSPLSR